MNKKRVLVILLTPLLACFIFYTLQAYFYRKSWEKETSPLTEETISKLCEKLSLSRMDSLCSGERDVYASDFNNVLLEYFPLSDAHRTPEDEATITYQEVDAVLGEFKWKCQDVEHFPASGYSSFRCFYDLRGDRYWRDVFYFYYPEETLYSIRSGTESSDWTKVTSSCHISSVSSPVESGLGVVSTAATLRSDYLKQGGNLNDWQLGEDARTSVLTFTLGVVSVEPFVDTATDLYASGYNHGFFCGYSTFLDCLR